MGRRVSGRKEDSGDGLGTNSREEVARDGTFDEFTDDSKRKTADLERSMVLEEDDKLITKGKGHWMDRHQKGLQRVPDVRLELGLGVTRINTTELVLWAVDHLSNGRVDDRKALLLSFIEDVVPVFQFEREFGLCSWDHDGRRRRRLRTVVQMKT